MIFQTREDGVCTKLLCPNCRSDNVNRNTENPNFFKCGVCTESDSTDTCFVEVISYEELVRLSAQTV